MCIDKAVGILEFNNLSNEVSVHSSFKLAKAILPSETFGEIEGVFRGMKLIDPNTVTHMERVSDITTAIAIAFAAAENRKIGEEDLNEITLGGLLHDIGKVKIRGEILTKPGKLDPNEFAQIVKHPTHSLSILDHLSGITQNMIDMAKYHHERMDGKGYPFKLKGGQIPFVARLVAIADAYEAMTSTLRPYREPKLHHDSIMEILKNSIFEGEAGDGQFDKRIAIALMFTESLDVKVPSQFL